MHLKSIQFHNSVVRVEFKYQGWIRTARSEEKGKKYYHSSMLDYGHQGGFKHLINQ